MKVIGTILRWFVLGALAGLLIAPRPGHATRELISEKFNQLVDGLDNNDNSVSA